MSEPRHPAYDMKAHRDTYIPHKRSTLIPRTVSAQLDSASADALIYLERQLPQLAIADLVRLGLITLVRDMRRAERRRYATEAV